MRLVCRRRKSLPIRTPMMQSATVSVDDSPQPAVSEVPPAAAIKLIAENTTQDSKNTLSEDAVPTLSVNLLTNRYFIMKSLEKEDLAWSVKSKVWATQPHNERVLNEAFNVCLSFGNRFLMV